MKKFGSEKSLVVKNFGSEKNGSEKFGGEKFGSQIHHTFSLCGVETCGNSLVVLGLKIIMLMQELAMHNCPHRGSPHPSPESCQVCEDSIQAVQDGVRV